MCVRAMDQWASGGSPVRPWRLGAVLVLGAYAAVFASWTWWHWWGDPTVLGDIAPIPMALCAAVFAWQASKSAGLAHRVGLAWRFVAFGCASWFVGECCWFYLEVVRHTQPFPSVADAFYLSFYPLMFVGLTMLPVPRARRGDRLTLGLDIATVMIATVMVVWYLVVGPTVESQHDSLLATVLSLAYPAGDLILVLGVARLLLRRPTRQLSRPLWFLAVGVGLLFVADVAYARLSLSNTYAPGTLPDELWLAGLFLLVLAGYAQSGHRSSGGQITDREAIRMQRSKLPYLALMIGLALLLYETTRDAQGPMVTLVLGSLALTSLVVWRQMIVMRQNQRLVTQLDQMANTDALTQLLNRRRFFELAERVVERAGHDGRTVAALMIDIDHFKDVNDQHGHAEGDHILQTVAQACTDALRPGDLFARYGGDEFVVLAPVDTAQHADRLAERLRASVAFDPIPTAKDAAKVTVSIGVATATNSRSVDELLQNADLALYQAKRAGRNQYAAAHADPAPMATDRSQPRRPRANRVALASRAADNSLAKTGSE